MCADIIESTLKEFNDQKQLKTPHLMVYLVNNDEPSVKEMERACMEILVSPTSEASRTVSEKKQKDEEQQVGAIFMTDSKTTSLSD